MPLRVFLSYSLEPGDRVVAWRLQTLAAANGVHLYVPSRQAFRLPSSRAPLLSREARVAIDRADFVLAIITMGLRPEVDRELQYARSRGKKVIPIVESGVVSQALRQRFPKMLIFSADNPPGRLEEDLATFLTQQRVAKEKRQALGALVSIGLGMLVLSALDK